MAKNRNLNVAKVAKNDEFYTQLNDVSNELKHYKAHFKDKVVLCNCDDSTWSAFWKYFHLNFEKLGLKKLISTHYDKEQSTYQIEYTGGSDNDTESGIVKQFAGNGDFRNAECIELLKQADIVVTNPPFSLFREYVAQLVEYDKKFIIIGSKNAIAYKEVFPLIKNNRVWLGYNASHGSMSFKISNSNILRSVASYWYTNLDFSKRHKPLTLYKKYTPEEYPKYDNLEAINVNKTADIPMDYDGVMGVPISFLDKYCPEQFELLDALNKYAVLDVLETNETIRKNHSHGNNINGKATYKRLLIRRRKR